MEAHDIFLWMHLILFAYWLGGDVGVFCSSKYVIDPTLQRETRLIAAKIMIGCDLVPKICMTLILTVGGILSEKYTPHPTWQMIPIVLLAPFWLTVVLLQHYKHHATWLPALIKFDFWFRVFIVISLLASTAYSWNTGRLAEHPWIAGKILIFAFLVFCGIMIRIGLKDFGTAYVKIIQNAYNDDDNAKMAASLNRVKPWVYSIWVGLAFEALLGFMQFGKTEAPVVDPVKAATAIEMPAQ